MGKESERWGGGASTREETRESTENENGKKEKVK